MAGLAYARRQQSQMLSSTHPGGTFKRTSLKHCGRTLSDDKMELLRALNQDRLFSGLPLLKVSELRKYFPQE